MLLQFEGCPKYTNQVNVLRTKKGMMQQPSKGTMAILAAKEMNRYMVRIFVIALITIIYAHRLEQVERGKEGICIRAR